MSPHQPSAFGLLFAGFNDRVVLGLGLTQTIGYGTLYYAYGVMAPAVSSTFNVGIDWFFAAFTAGLLLGGVVAPIVGRALDRRGARAVMAFGSIAAGLALTACALSPTIWLFAASLILAEAAACLVLYEAAFAGLTQIHGHDARQRITAVTLMAGFASTIFWPLTQWMMTDLGWRGTLLVFAVVHVLVCAPLHAAILQKRGANQIREGEALSGSPEPTVLIGASRRRALILYTTAVVISGIVYSAFPVHMLRIIENEGFSSEAAALIAMVMGPSQVLARLIEVLAGNRTDPLTTGRVALGSLVAGIFLLLLAPGSMIVAVAFAAFYGVAQGLITIARGTVPLQLFGPKGYATLVGRITGLRFLVNAASPFLFAFSMTRWGVDAALLASSALAILAFIAFLTLRPPGRPAT